MAPVLASVPGRAGEAARGRSTADPGAGGSASVRRGLGIPDAARVLRDYGYGRVWRWNGVGIRRWRGGGR